MLCPHISLAVRALLQVTTYISVSRSLVFIAATVRLSAFTALSLIPLGIAKLRSPYLQEVSLAPNSLCLTIIILQAHK